MNQAARNIEEIARIGTEVYEARIRDKVVYDHKGEMLVLDIDTGDYEIDKKNDALAEDRLRRRRPDGTFFGLRIGYKTAYSLGGRMIEDR